MKTTKGKFSVSGYSNLPDDVKKLVWKQVKVGDSLTLVADPENKFDKYAIKVLFNSTQIGWYSAKGYRQNELFEALIKGISIRSTVISNDRRQTRWGQQQFVEAKFEYEFDETTKPKAEPQQIDMEQYRAYESALSKLKRFLKK